MYFADENITNLSSSSTNVSSSSSPSSSSSFPSSSPSSTSSTFAEFRRRRQAQNRNKPAGAVADATVLSAGADADESASWAVAGARSVGVSTGAVDEDEILLDSLKRKLSVAYLNENESETLRKLSSKMTFDINQEDYAAVKDLFQILDAVASPYGETM